MRGSREHPENRRATSNEAFRQTKHSQPSVPPARSTDQNHPSLETKAPTNESPQRTLTVIGDAYSGTAWLFMYDMFDIGKVYFRLGYHDGDDVSAYADAHKLRVPLHDLFHNGYLNPKLYDVKQGDTAGIDVFGGSTKGEITSTIVTISDDPNRRLPISIVVSSGPGSLGENGDIRPKRNSQRTRVAISMSRQEARTMAGQALGHYTFWETRKRQYVKPRP